MQLHNLKVSKKKNKKRVGRGGVHGTYSTRGNKGQKARSGGKSIAHKAAFGRSSSLKRMPKIGGFRSPYMKDLPLNLDTLEKDFSNGEIVCKSSLRKKGLINKSDKRSIKILSQGKLTKKLIFEGCSFSKSSKEKIEKIGGKIN